MHLPSIVCLALPWLASAAPSWGKSKASSYGGGSSSSYNLVTFYVNWAIYGRQYFVTDLPASQLTKVNYAFANINNVTGEVYLSDEWADLQYAYPGDVAGNGTTLLGNFNQLYLLKKKYRQLKTVLSVGGWTYRTNFPTGLATAENRQRFANSSLTLVKDLGLDGIDVDWEYPDSAEDAANLVATVKELRSVFDSYSAQYANGYKFLVTVSSPAGPDHYQKMDLSGMDSYVDYWNLMAFDYAGSFSNLTGHLSNVFPSIKNPLSTPFNTEQAVTYYSQHVASEKIILGMPIYGRSFNNTKGLGLPYNGTGSGTWEAGVWDYKALPLAGSKVYHDVQTVTSWSYDSKQGLLISYDTPEIAAGKTEYLKRRSLGGAFWWESSADKAGNDSLVTTVYNSIGAPSSLDTSTNWLSYPNSKYDNIRNAA